MQHVSCNVCKATNNLRIERETFDDRYGYHGKYELLKCTNCGHIFLQAEFTLDQISHLYSQYYPRSSFKVDDYRMRQVRKGFDAWLDGAQSSVFRWIPRNVRILDIGCGFGETLGYHKTRGCDVYGVEADENIRRVAERYGYKVIVGLFDPKDYSPCSFDYVTMDQVIEHLQDPVATLCGVSQVLKPGGVLILSTPNPSGWGARLFISRWINWHTPYHLQFFSKNSMEMAASKAGFILESVQTITNSNWLHFQWIHLLTFPKPGTPSVFWAPNETRSLFNTIIINGLSIMHLTKVNHLITRLFDTLGLGDNRIFYLRKVR